VSDISFEDLAPLAILRRAGLAESFHHGVAVIVDPRGGVIQALGDISKPMYPRSALKPVQALAMRNLGLDLSGAELVMSMASHQATEGHTQLALSILESHGLAASHLKCPRAFPGNPAARAKTNEMSRIAMNCSGKHAAFLATCSIKNWDIENYLDPEHPLQQEILKLVEELAGEKVFATTADGCGAPLFALSTQGLARAIQGFSKASPEMVRTAIENPWVIGDHGSPDAVFLEHGLMAKIGAEGVFVVTTQDHHAIAIKIADGNLRAAPVVAVELLRKHKLVDQATYESVLAKVEPKVLGGDLVTGKLEVTF